MASVIFDLDGTLINSAPDLQGIANRILANMHKQPLTIEETRNFIGNGVGVFVQKMCDAREIDAAAHPSCLEDFMAAYPTAFTLTKLYPGVVDELKVLKRQNHLLGLCTNKPMAPTQTVLEHLHLDQFFDAIVAGDSLSQRKPHPAPLLLAIERLSEGPAVYVGDSEIDAETAESAETPFLLYTNGYRKKPCAELKHAGTFDHFDRLSNLVAETIGAKPQ